MSLSWCPQDNDLLLSCGKDNRSICWNPQTGDSYGEFSVVTNWTFQTRWNPRNPNILATASFDGKIEVQSIQTTLSEADVKSERNIQLSDDKDFFNIAQVYPRDSSFILPNAPKWMKRPCGAAFGFGGKILSFNLARKTGTLNHSTIRISQFAIDVEVSAYTAAFDKALNLDDLKDICKTRIEESTNISDKSDWKTIEALTLDNPRKEIIGYLGFSSASDPAAETVSATGREGSASINEVDPKEAKTNSLSAFFDNPSDAGNFLSNLKASQGAMTNNPFQIYSGSETESQQQITRALLLGHFDKALDVSLREGNLSDAFMIAICGGETCIAKVQKAYFNQKSEGPNYLRLLASVVNKNLWDVVYNADLSGWKEVMTVLCTYAGAEEFSDLCEALGGRLEGEMEALSATTNVRKDASFCYLAGSKLEKVVNIWISDLERHNDSAQIKDPSQSNFSAYARSLQSFIEKVTVFREVIHFQDSDRLASSGWKLARLYDRYVEYADMVASYGQLAIAERYLALVPENYPGAEVSKNRVKEALTKPLTGANSSFRSHAQKVPPNVASTNGQQDQQREAEHSVSNLQNPYQREIAGQRHVPVTQLSGGLYDPKKVENTAVNQRSYQPQSQPQPYRGAAQPPGFGLPHQNQEPIPLLQKGDGLSSTLTAPQTAYRTTSQTTSQTPSQTQNKGNWNDTPESFFRPPTSRRGTPGVNAVNLANSQINPNTIQRPTSGFQPKPVSPLAPPPRNLAGPPPRMNSPSNLVSQAIQPPVRSASAIAGAYAPPQSASSVESVTQTVSVPRGPSPYHTLPSSLPPSNRYAPAPSSNLAAAPNQSGSAMMSGPNRQGLLPPNPYVPQENITPQQTNGPGQYDAASSIPPAVGQSLMNLEPHRGPPDVPPKSSKPGPAQVQQPNIASFLSQKHR